MESALQGGSVSDQLNSNHEIHLKVLREIAGNPEITQRELAQQLGVSLGKANYCIKALIDSGWVKVKNFKNSQRKKLVIHTTHQFLFLFVFFWSL